MPTSLINGVRLYWEQHGESGAPLVLVHGSWGDHHNWDSVVGPLARSFRVFTYDRRGHSQSEGPATQGSIDEDAEDLASFITSNRLAPAHVAGNSFGAAITLKLAASQPTLLQTITVHEPPLLGMLQGEPMLAPLGEWIAAVVERLKAGDMERGAELFVERALGPGTWNKLPPEMRRTFVFNAPTFLDEQQQPENAMTVDLARLSAFDRAALVTRGGQSPPFYALILDKIVLALPSARRHVFAAGGHVPHVSHPDEYASVVTRFLRENGGATL